MFKIIPAALLIISLNTFAQQQIDSLLEKGQYKKAISLLKKETTANSKRKLGKIYIKIGNYQLAQENLKSIAQKTSDDSLNIARIEYKIGAKNQALQYMMKSYKQQTSNLLLGLELATIYYRNKEYKKAIPLYESLIKKDTSNYFYSYQLARCLEQQKQYQKAVKAYKNALKKNPKKHQALYHLANHYSKKRDRDSTLYFIDKALALKPNNGDYLKLKVLTLYKKQQFDKSIKTSKKILETASNNGFAYNSLGLCYYNKKMLDSAIFYQTKAFFIAKTSSEYSKNLALIYEAKKDYKIATNFYNYSLKMLKQKTYIQNYHLGLIALTEHKPKKALQHFDKAYKNNPKYHDALYMRALTAENYYKDKKVALKDYKLYLEKFKKKDTEKTAFVKVKIKSLEEHLFFEEKK